MNRTTFTAQIENFDPNTHVVIVVQILTDIPYGNTITAEKTVDYYIEYVANFSSLIR